mgnify:CR=1 FL=1
MIDVKIHFEKISNDQPRLEKGYDCYRHIQSHMRYSAI